ncbi:hypothetical protein H311_03671, partial [Anncaliia algerae PRA109]
MVIKGPKSALTDFLEEKGIKIKYSKRKEKKTKEIILANRTNKKRYESKPYELININNYSPLLRDICLKKIEENFTTNAILKGESLELFSKYLADNNKMNYEYFSYIINQSDDGLKIYDCSMIKDEYFLINKSFKNIELLNCGQLTEETANKLINFNKNLEELSLIGAFQISKLNLPNKLKVLNLSDTKITDEFIEYLNA